MTGESEVQAHSTSDIPSTAALLIVQRVVELMGQHLDRIEHNGRPLSQVRDGGEVLGRAERPVCLAQRPRAAAASGAPSIWRSAWDGLNFLKGPAGGQQHRVRPPIQCRA